MKSVLGHENPIVPPPGDYKGNFFEDAKMSLVGVGMISIDERMGMPMLEKGKLHFSGLLSGNIFEDPDKAINVTPILVSISFPCLISDYNNISKFLNRILGIEVEVQNQLFKYFTDTLTAIILQAKRHGRWDMGILGECGFN